MQIRAVASAVGRDPVREHRDDVVELRPRQIPIRVRLVDESEEVVLTPFLTGDRRDQLLGEHVPWPRRDLAAVETALIDGAHEGCALDQLVACRRE